MIAQIFSHFISAKLGEIWIYAKGMSRGFSPEAQIEHLISAEGFDRLQ